jgi:hypothetical protein
MNATASDVADTTVVAKNMKSKKALSAFECEKYRWNGKRTSRDSMLEYETLSMEASWRNAWLRMRKSITSIKGVLKLLQIQSFRWEKNFFNPVQLTEGRFPLLLS